MFRQIWEFSRPIAFHIQYKLHLPRCALASQIRWPELPLLCFAGSADNVLPLSKNMAACVVLIFGQTDKRWTTIHFCQCVTALLVAQYVHTRT